MLNLLEQMEKLLARQREKPTDRITNQIENRCYQIHEMGRRITHPVIDIKSMLSRAQDILKRATLLESGKAENDSLPVRKLDPELVRLKELYKHLRDTE